MDQKALFGWGGGGVIHSGGSKGGATGMPPPPLKLDQLCFFFIHFLKSECLKIRLRLHERALKQL